MGGKGNTDTAEKEKTGARGSAPVHINGIRPGNSPTKMRRVVGKRKIAIFDRIIKMPCLMRIKGWPTFLLYS